MFRVLPPDSPPPTPRAPFVVSRSCSRFGVERSSYFRHFSSLDTCRRPGAGRNSEPGLQSLQSASEAIKSEAQLHVSVRWAVEAGSARAAASSAGGAFLGCRVRRAKRALMCSQIWHVALDPRTDAQVEFAVHVSFRARAIFTLAVNF